jgi:hypothetical protein
MVATAHWADVFDITVVLAITAEEGLQLLKQIMLSESRPT